jgi:hypothetical protein
VAEEMVADMGLVEEERESEDVEKWRGKEVDLGIGLQDLLSFLGHLTSEIFSFLNRLLVLLEDLFFFFTFSASSGFKEDFRRIWRSFFLSLTSYSESFCFGLLVFCGDFLSSVLLEMSLELGRELVNPVLGLKSEELGLREEMEHFLVEV